MSGRVVRTIDLRRSDGGDDNQDPKAGQQSTCAPQRQQIPLGGNDLHAEGPHESARACVVAIQRRCVRVAGDFEPRSRTGFGDDASRGRKVSGLMAPRTRVRVAGTCGPRDDAAVRPSRARAQSRRCRKAGSNATPVGLIPQSAQSTLTRVDGANFTPASRMFFAHSTAIVRRCGRSRARPWPVSEWVDFVYRDPDTIRTVTGLTEAMDGRPWHATTRAHRNDHFDCLCPRTWARGSRWSRFESEVRRVFGAERVIVGYLDWSGRNTVSARIEASEALAEFLRADASNHPLARRFVIAHSHGGTVALLGVRDPALQDLLDGVVCLSTPFLLVRPRALSRSKRRL